MSQKVVAMIPARGGSQGIPRKNVISTAGRPLVAWCIESAIKSLVFDEVWVSTDDEEIAAVAQNYGALVHSRDASTATSEASTESAMLDFLNHHTADIIFLIQGTSPLTLPEHFSGALQKFRAKRADSLVTVTRRHIFLWSEDGCALNYEPSQRPRRQDWGGVLVENGAFYITKVDVFKSTKNRLGGTTTVYELPASHSADIDDVQDLAFCDMVLRNRQ